MLQKQPAANVAVDVAAAGGCARPVMTTRNAKAAKLAKKHSALRASRALRSHLVITE